MIVTIIGSLSKSKEMLYIKECFEKMGCDVNCPEKQEKPIIESQLLWLSAIEEADLIVAMPKENKKPKGRITNYEMLFGESTSYEMAIAMRLKKPIVFWSGANEGLEDEKTKKLKNGNQDIVNDFEEQMRKLELLELAESHRIQNYNFRQCASQELEKYTYVAPCFNNCK